jgi:transcriptional regulator GlxA family with amidase domain
VAGETVAGATVARETAHAETVADVAARCGFSSAAYFSHAFRLHFGVRASELKRG